MTSFKSKTFNLKVIILLWFIPLVAFSQTESEGKSVIDTLSFDYELFDNEKPLRLTLKSDFRKFRKEKFVGKYQPAELSYQLIDTQITHKIKIKARGKNRKENCFFPPISLNLKKVPENGKNLRFYKLKMVVHCKVNKIYEKYLLKEYLCYKLYSSFSDKSFKVRLLEVKYIDIGFKKPKETKMYAFLIEDQKIMAERLSARLDKNMKFSQTLINQQQIMELAMFQFMIGNFDWAVPTQQNIKLIRPHNNPNEIYAIPYDFDYCGLVNANYAIPSEALGINSVRQRIYLGECKPLGEFLPVIEKFKKHKDKFYGLIESFEYLSVNDKKLMIKYLDKYYGLLDLKGFYSNYIKRTCKKIKAD